MAGKKPLFSADAAEEYFSTLLTYYRNTANDIFKRDNEGRHVSDQIYSAEYQKYLGMQIAMHEVLEYFAKFELGDTAIRQQETVTNRNGLNEPLTLNELREMVGEPVWCKELECYGIIKIETIGRFANTPFLIGVYHDFDLGTAVNFEYDIKRRHFSLYRQKPEEDDRDERKENENA